MCIDLGIVPAGTPLKKLPFGYGKAPIQVYGEDLVFMTIPKNDELELMIES
jgi:hypothetical protein